MKKTFVAVFAVAAMLAASAMAHGPPSALDSIVKAPASISLSIPGGSGGIKFCRIPDGKGITPVPVNERMLN